MHRYYFFQYSPDTDTFIFLYLPISSTDTDIFIAFVNFLDIGYRNQKSMYNVSWLTSFIHWLTKIYPDTFNISHIITVYSL